MRISLKLIAILWIGLFIIMGGLFYNAYKKLNPEVLVSLLKEQVEKNYPNSELKVGAVEYKYSIDFNVHLKDLILTRQDKELGSIKEVELKIPWWLLLFKRGNAQINLTNLVIYIDQSKLPKEDSVAKQGPETNRVTLQLPNYLAEANYTLRAHDIFLKDASHPRTYLHLSKLLLREFQYNKNSAFELTIPIEINHKKAKYKSELWLFGDVTPTFLNWKLNYRGEIKTTDTSDKFQIEDLVIDGKANFKPAQFDISSHLNLLIEKEPIGNGSVMANKDELSVALNFTGLPLNFLSLFDEEIGNPFLTSRDGVAEGYLKLVKNNEESLDLSGRLRFNGLFNLDKKNPIQGKWQYNLNGSKWEISFISPKGEVSFFRRAYMDFEKGQNVQFTEELGFTGLDINLAINPVLAMSQLQSLPSNKFFNTTVSFKKCPMGTKFIEGFFKYGVTPDLKFYSSELNDGMGNFKLNFQDKNTFKQIEMLADKFVWISNFKFLEPYFSAQTAQIGGKIQGEWSGDWAEGKWLGKIQLDNVSEISGMIPELNQKLWKTFEIDSTSAKIQTWNFEVKNNSINNILQTLNSGDLAKLTGALYSRPAPKSFLVLGYPKNKKWKSVRKDVKNLYWQKESNE